MNIKEYVRPSSIKEAYEHLTARESSIIGGGTFMLLSDIKLDKAIDLSNLELSYIQESKLQLEIGAMTTLRELETNAIANQVFDGVLAKAAGQIMGVQLRNTATVGGTLFGKYSFSDLITVLLALNAKVELYSAGVMSLEDYLQSPFCKDILLKVVIDKKVSKAEFACFKKTSTDFSVLNTAAAIVDQKLRIAVGSRPGRAKLARGAMSFLEIIDSSQSAAEMAGLLASEELSFGTDLRASSPYRKELCKALVKRCVREVLK